MVKGILARALLVAALASPLPAATVAQDEDLAPASLEGLALGLIVQAEQIHRLHERIDNVRIGVLRERVKNLEAAVSELSNAFAAEPFAVVAATENHQ